MTIPKIWKRITFLSVLTLITNSYTAAKEIINIPVIVLVIFILVAFWVTVPLLIIGMFCGFKYSFRGDMAGTININSACDKAAQTCVNIKKEFTDKQE